MSVYIEQRGSGPDLVMLHGWGLHGGLWGEFADALARDFTLHIVDLPGHGYSDVPERLTVSGMVDAVTDRLELKADASVLGWSMGAFVALEMTVRYPDRFNRLAWIAGTPSFTQREGWPVGMAPATLQKFADGLKQDYRATLKRFISLNGGENGERLLLKAMQQQVFERGEPTVDTLDQGLEILRNTDMRDVLAASRIPLLMIQGTHDRLVHPDTVTAVGQLRPARSRLFERAGHAPFLAEPNRVAEALREFVR